VLRITLSGSDELLIGVASVLVVITLIAAHGDCDSLWSLLWPSLVAYSTPPCTLVGFLGWHPPTTAGGHLGTALYENSLDRFLAGGMPGGDVEEFLCGLWLVTTKLVYLGSIVYARPELRDDIDVADLVEFVTLLEEAPDVIP
jgi:hypothetical protein